MSYVKHTERHAGMIIRIQQDCSPQNPWEDGDCEPPIYVRGSVRFMSVDPKAPDLDDPLAIIGEAAAMKHFHAIADAMDMPADERTAALLEATEASRLPWPLASDFRDILAGWLYANVDDTDRLDVIAAILNAADIPAATFNRSGYCQGDWCNVLVALTPAWRDRVGAQSFDLSSDDPALNGMNTMAAAADLWAAYAFGDVYGFEIVAPDPELDDDEHDDESDGELVDSCWGFFCTYGSTGWTYMLDEARAAAESEGSDHEPTRAAA